MYNYVTMKKDFQGRFTLAHYSLSDRELDIVYSALHQNPISYNTKCDLNDITKRHKIVFYYSKKTGSLLNCLVNNEYLIRLKTIKET